MKNAKGVNIRRDPTGHKINVNATPERLPGKAAHDQFRMTKDRAMEIFNILSGIGYAVSIKHLGGYYFIEVPVRLKGDPAHGREGEIIALAARGGFVAIQTGRTLRIRG